MNRKYIAAIIAAVALVGIGIWRVASHGPKQNGGSTATTAQQAPAVKASIEGRWQTSGSRLTFSNGLYTRDSSPSSVEQGSYKVTAQETTNDGTSFSVAMYKNGLSPARQEKFMLKSGKLYYGNEVYTKN
jgi:hypothetical protein